MTQTKRSMLSYWKESFGLLRWKNFKLILLVTLATFKRALTVLIKEYWWLIAGLGVTGGALAYISKVTKIASEFSPLPVGRGHLLLYMLLGSAFFGAYMYLFYVACLATRASTEVKDAEYFRTYRGGFWRWLGFLGVISIIYVAFVALASFFSGVLIYSVLKSGLAGSLIVRALLLLIGSALALYFVYYLSIFCFAVYIAVFFYLDGNLSFSSFKPALKRGWVLSRNFLPLLIGGSLLLILITLPFVLSKFLFVYLGPITTGVVSIVYYLLVVASQVLVLSFLSVCYYKIKHSHYNLFFKED